MGRLMFDVLIGWYRANLSDRYRFCLCPKAEAFFRTSGDANQGVARHDCSRHTESVIPWKSGHATQRSVGAVHGARFLLRNTQRQDSFADFCGDAVKIQAVSKPQHQAIVALGTFQVE